MRKYKINITEAAELDLAEIASDNPVAALKLADKIDESIGRLEDFLQSGVIPKNRRLEGKQNDSC